MLGKALQVSPVLSKGLSGKDTFEVHFQQGSYVNLNEVSEGLEIKEKNGKNVTLQASLSYTNVHLKAMNIVPY